MSYTLIPGLPAAEASADAWVIAAVAGELEDLRGRWLPEAGRELAKHERHMIECPDCPDADHHHKVRAELLAVKCQIQERIDELFEFMAAS